MFTFKGRTSHDMGLRIAREVTFSSPSRSIDSVAVDGRNGTLIIDRGRYENVDWGIPVILIADNGIEERLTDIADWLLTDVGFHDFLWDSDPDFVYRAMCHQQFNINHLLRTLGKGIINFKMHPIKFLKTGLTERQIANNTNVVNPYNINAKPRLRINGSGNITIRIQNTDLVLRGIAGGCIVDSETQTITSLDGRITLFDRMYSYPFPELSPGSNVITVPGGVQLHMIPRLGALI